MKPHCLFLFLFLLLGSIPFAGFAAAPATSTAPPPGAASSVQPAPPPAAPAKRSAADLEKLVAPIALYPDPLIATILPASVYPLEIVQAARFVTNTNNLAQLDAQPWDANVKAVARIPEVIRKLNDDLSWTMELGEVFLAQDKDVMDAIQSLRAKAREVGTLATTPQQVVTVTNTIVEKTVEQKVVVVTNTVVQIQPSNPQVVYVPTYNPAVVYYPPPPTYTGPPPVVTFAAGIAVGSIIANNCDWYHGGCYHGDVNIDIDRNVNVNRNANINRNVGVSGTAAGGPQKWQPDPARLGRSGTPASSAAVGTQQARGWGSSAGGVRTTQAGARPSAGAAPVRSPAGANTGMTAGSRPTTAAGARPATPSPSVSPATAGRSAPMDNAFSGAGNGGRAREASNRGVSSRTSGSSGGGRLGRR